MFHSNRFELSGKVRCSPVSTHQLFYGGRRRGRLSDNESRRPASITLSSRRLWRPYLVDGQTVVLNPGRTFGTYVFEKTLRENGCKADILLGKQTRLSLPAAASLAIL